MPVTTGDFDGPKGVAGGGVPGADPITPAARRAPREATFLVETSATYLGGWTPRPELELLFAARFLGLTPDTAQFQRRYGAALKDPTDQQPADRLPLRLAGHWVQIKLIGRGDPQVIWGGRIFEETDEPDGSESPLTDKPGGMQHYVAYGALRILERINFSTSWWFENGALKEIGWLPGFNSQVRAASGAAVPRGNRSPAAHSIAGRPSTYLFGGDELWDWFQILDYLLRQMINPQFMDGTATFKPGGQLSTLQQIREYFPLREAENAAECLARLVPEKYGLSFHFPPLVDETGFYGWEFRVVSRCPNGLTLGGITIPSEPVTPLPLLTDRRFRLAVQRSVENRVRAIRAIGERVVSCFSLGPNAIGGGQLRQGWSDEAATAYYAASDQERGDDRFRDVFQVFLAPANFDFQAGAANPVIPDRTAGGSPAPVWTGSGVTPPAYQLRVRETLERLPLREGYDYTVVPPVPTASAPADPYDLTYMPLAVWAQVSPTIGGTVTPLRMPADRLSVFEGQQAAAAVAPLDNALGVRIRSAPNHAYALNVASFATSAFVPSADNAVDWRLCDLTIACELDQRLTLEHVATPLSAADVVNDGGTLLIEVADAHFHWLAPQTIVGVSGNGYRRSPATGTVLRDDRYKLAFAIAGAVALEQRDRIAAAVQIREVADYGAILGYFVAPTYRNGNTVLDKAQVSGVRWDGTALSTALRLG